MDTKTWLYGMLCLLVVSLAGCATAQPGNPAYAWLNGRWLGNTPGFGEWI